MPLSLFVVHMLLLSVYFLCFRHRLMLSPCYCTDHHRMSPYRFYTGSSFLNWCPPTLILYTVSQSVTFTIYLDVVSFRTAFPHASADSRKLNQELCPLGYLALPSQVGVYLRLLFLPSSWLPLGLGPASAAARCTNQNCPS